LNKFKVGDMVYVVDGEEDQFGGNYLTVGDMYEVTELSYPGMFLNDNEGYIYNQSRFKLIKPRVKLKMTTVTY
jgi:hypothetical protein